MKLITKISLAYNNSQNKSTTKWTPSVLSSDYFPVVQKSLGAKQELRVFVTRKLSLAQVNGPLSQSSLTHSLAHSQGKSTKTYSAWLLPLFACSAAHLFSFHCHPRNDMQPNNMSKFSMLIHPNRSNWTRRKENEDDLLFYTRPWPLATYLIAECGNQCPRRLLIVFSPFFTGRTSVSEKTAFTVALCHLTVDRYTRQLKCAQFIFTFTSPAWAALLEETIFPGTRLPSSWQ